MSFGRESFIKLDNLNNSVSYTNEKLDKSYDNIVISPEMKMESEQERLGLDIDNDSQKYKVSVDEYDLADALLSFTDRLDDGHSESYIDLRNAIRDSAEIIRDIRKGSFIWTSANYRAYNRLFEAVSRYINDHFDARSKKGKRRLQNALTLKLTLNSVSTDILKKEKIKTDVEKRQGNKEELAAAKENIGRFMEYYRAYCKRIGDDLLASDEEKIRRRWNAIKSCEQDILIYLEYKERKGKMNSEDQYLKAEYYSLRNQMLMRELAVQKGEKKAFSEKNLKTIKKHEKELNKDTLNEEKENLVKQDDGLSKEQIAALSKIDTWVVRNFRNGGYMSMFHQASDRTDILGRLFSMDRRKRLYVYYLVETRQRVQPSPEGLICSQLEYKPDLATFKKHMVATKLKFYARFSGGYVYWNKLTEAIAMAEQATPVLKDISDFLAEEKEQEKVPKRLVLEDNRIILDDNRSIDFDDLEDIPLEDLNVAEELLNKQLMGSAIKAIRQLQIRDADILDKNEAPVLKEDDKIKGITNTVQAVMDRLSQIKAELERRKGKEAEAKKDVKQYGNQMPKDLLGVAGVVELGLGDVLKNALTNGIDLYKPDFDAIKDLDFKNAFKKFYTLEPSEKQISNAGDFYKGTSNGIKILSNLVGLYFIYRNMKENYSGMNRYDVVSNVGDFGLTAYKTFQSGIKIAQIFKGEEFLKFITSKTTNAYLGGIDCVIAVVKGMSHYRNGSHRSKASTLAKEKQGKDKFRDGMVKLNRKLGRKQKTDTISAGTTALISGGAAVLIATSVISAGAAPVAGLIVGAAAFGIGILKRFISNKFSKDMKMELFDNFFKIDKAVEDVKNEWRQKNPDRNMTPDQEKRIVNQVRRRIAADLGFYSPTHASKTLAKEYAKYLLDNARGGENCEMCISMIRGLGLQFKTDLGTGEIIVPEASDIEKKLCG